MSKKNIKHVNARTSLDFSTQIKKIDVGVKSGVFYFIGPMTIENFANAIKKNPTQIIRHYFLKGKVTNNNTLLSEEEIAELCLEFGLDFEKKVQIDETNVLNNLKIVDNENELQPRAPIVTIMGHVDHGKTTLLDYIRKSNVVKGEAGGITQHIGAYQITYDNKKITFIDTPGHEAFSQMRARGANITDIIVLVVSAEDGIRPQTLEAIEHAKSSGAEIIVFINKMDKPNVNPDVVMKQLSDKGLVPEEWGGNTITIKGSALKGTNVDKLLESILTIAEINEYKANPNRLAIGTVLESSLDKGLGAVATVLIKTGTLLKGDFVIAGSSFGRIKIMFDENSKEVKEAEPSKPVKIVGLNKTPDAGQTFIVSTDENQIKEMAKKIDLHESFTHAYDLANNVVAEGTKKINIILKTDVHGTLEAIKSMLSKIEVEGTKLTIIRSAVGGISETDVNLAKSSNSVIIGFNIKPSRALKDVADSFGVKILFYNIIYKLQEDMVAILKGQLEPTMVEKETGEARILQLWSHSAVGTIAGCIVMNGDINRNDSARILRDGKVLFSTKIGSMKHLKDNVNKVTAGMEFGITLQGFNDLRVDDVIQCYKIVESKII